MKDVKLQTNE